MNTLKNIFFVLSTGYWLAKWSSSTPIKRNRWVTVVVSILFALYFFFVTAPASPIAIVVLPVLFGLSYWGLRQNRIIEDEGALLETLNGNVSLQNYFGLLGLPITSIFIYALAMSINLKATNALPQRGYPAKSAGLTQPVRQGAGFPPCRYNVAALEMIRQKANPAEQLLQIGNKKYT